MGRKYGVWGILLMLLTNVAWAQLVQVTQIKKRVIRPYNEFKLTYKYSPSYPLDSSLKKAWAQLELREVSTGGKLLSWEPQRWEVPGLLWDPQNEEVIYLNEVDHDENKVVCAKVKYLNLFFKKVNLGLKETGDCQFSVQYEKRKLDEEESRTYAVFGFSLRQ